jgi:hypothetical protein
VVEIGESSSHNTTTRTTSAHDDVDLIWDRHLEEL